jgi:hypothetical protein
MYCPRNSGSFRLPTKQIPCSGGDGHGNGDSDDDGDCDRDGTSEIDGNDKLMHDRRGVYGGSPWNQVGRR